MKKPAWLAASVMLSIAVFPAMTRAVVPWTNSINTNNFVVVTNAAYGAVGDNATDNTAAIQNAINQATKGGLTNGLRGGTVEIPASGIYLCGPLSFSNNVNLQIDAGAILRVLPYGSYPGYPYTNSSAVSNFINGSSLTNIEISGSGAVDGQGLPWWQANNTNSAVNRPRLINFSSCNRLMIQNVTLSNSPMFHLSIGSGNMTVQGVVIRAPSSSAPVNPSHNTDACDVNGTNIVVQNCDISTGDDDFACIGGTRDVLLTNNVYGTGHGVSIGSYTSGGVSNFLVINCTFNGTDNGIRLKSERGRGGLVQNLTYCNLTMTNVLWPLLVYSYYEYGLGTLTGVNPTFAANVDATNSTALSSTDPIWQNITFSNITATAVPNGRPPLMVWGLPEALASNIIFRSVNITSSSTLEPGVYNATNIQFIDCNFNMPSGVNDLQFYNAGLIFTNTYGTATTTNLWAFNGLTTNGLGNTLQFYNALGTLKNTNAFGNGPLTLSASTFTISNNLTLFTSTILNYTLSTNTTKLAVTGNLMLGGTNNITAGPGFTNGTYTLMTYAGTLSGSLPALGTVPSGYTYQFDTNTVGVVKLVVTSIAPAPAAPTNLTATASNALIALQWSASATATNYNVKRSLTSGSGYATIASLVSTNFSDTQMTNGMTYYYVVSASNAGGESANSTEVSATPVATPANLTATAGDAQAALSWNPAAGATSYNVKRATISGGPYTTITNVTTTNYTDINLTDGMTYYYVVSGVNVSGESGNSIEAGVTPQSQFIVITTNVFTDTFATSTLNSTTPSAPTPTNTSYEVLSSKSWNPAPSIGAGHLKFGIAATASGSIEVQALFANAVTLATTGDSISLTVTFTNTAGILTSNGLFAIGLYRAGTNSPVPGGLNSTATTAYSTNAVGCAQPWIGYFGQTSFTNSASQILTRPAQITGTLLNNDQDVLTTGSGSSSFSNNAASTVGTASSPASVMLAAGYPYTEVLTFVLTASNTLAITNALYSGTDTNGALLSRFGGPASGPTYLTNTFDALGIGWRETGSQATAIDINRISITSTLTVTNPNYSPSLPAAPTNLLASATNLLINVKWNAVAGALDYNLKRGASSNGPWTSTFAVATTNYADNTVSNAVNYYYVVAALTNGSESANSLPASAIPLPSNQPTNLAARAAGNQLQLSWPQDHLGWRLQYQTNSVSHGLDTNWLDWPGATNVCQTNIFISPAASPTFFRLVYP